MVNAGYTIQNENICNLGCSQSQYFQINCCLCAAGAENMKYSVSQRIFCAGFDPRTTAKCMKNKGKQ